MGTLDDAIREHLALKRRLGASEEELQQKETEAFGAAATPPPSQPAVTELEPEFQVERTSPAEDQASADSDPWEPAGSEEEEDLFAPEPDEILPHDPLEPNGAYAPPPPSDLEPLPAEQDTEEPHEDPLDEWEEEPAPTEDVLRETPEFLEETPEHDRLWFEQKPPKDFDLD
jgi:hypothetical protein